MIRRACNCLAACAVLHCGLLAGCDDSNSGTSGTGASGGGTSEAASAAQTPAATRAQPPKLEPARYLTGHRDGVHAVDFSPDGKTLVTASHDGTAALWEVETGELVRTLEGHQGAVYSAAFSPDGSRVVTGGEEGLVLVWDVESGDLLAMLEGHSDWATAVEYLPDGSVVSGARDGSLRRWDVGEERQTWAVRGDPVQVNALAVSPDGTRLASGGYRGFLIVWDLRTGRPVWRESVPKNREQEKQLRARQSAKAMTRDGAAAEDGEEPAGQAPREEPSPVMNVTFSPDGSKLYSQTYFNVVHEWQAADGTIVRHFQPFSPAMAVDVSRDGRWFLVSSAKGPRVFDAQTIEPTAELLPPLNPVHDAAFSPDGRFAAMGHGGGWKEGRFWVAPPDPRVPIWDLSSLKPATQTASP